MTATNITLTKRSATLAHINPRTERHGEEDKPACDLNLEGILLGQEELDAILPHASSCWFTSEDGFDIPAFPELRPLRLVHKFEGAKVVLSFGTDGSNRPLELDGVTIAKVTLEPLRGGETALSLQVQTLLPSRMQELLERLGHTVHLAILEATAKDASDGQGSLPLAAPEAA
jgi:hypothetical protein